MQDKTKSPTHSSCVLVLVCVVETEKAFGISGSVLSSLPGPRYVTVGQVNATLLVETYVSRQYIDCTCWFILHISHVEVRANSTLLRAPETPSPSNPNPQKKKSATNALFILCGGVSCRLFFLGKTKNQSSFCHFFFTPAFKVECNDDKVAKSVSVHLTGYIQPAPGGDDFDDDDEMVRALAKARYQTMQPECRINAYTCSSPSNDRYSFYIYIMQSRYRSLNQDFDGEEEDDEDEDEDDEEGTGDEKVQPL
jgi:hypothetical protein